MSVIHVISVSTGKDSGATAILALETQPRESLRFIACDTGNEHENFHPYLRYMERHLGITINVLRADLSQEVIRFRDYVRDFWPAKGVPEADCERAIKALVPTGNPFLDLCLWKGRFPSRRAQFCTDFLKTRPSVEYQMGLIDSGQCEAVWSWQGVRIDESAARRERLSCPVHPSFHKFFEESGGGIFNYRPILRWAAADCFEAHRIAASSRTASTSWACPAWGACRASTPARTRCWRSASASRTTSIASLTGSSASPRHRSGRRRASSRTRTATST